MSLIYKRKSTGPNIQPCETPIVMFHIEELQFLIETYVYLHRDLYVYSLSRNPDLDDRIFYCLLASTAAVQAEDVRASSPFVSDLNGHHQEPLGTTTTNRHGVAAFDFATVSACDQLVVGPTHALGGTLDLLMTDVPDLVWVVVVVAPIGNSDHSSLSQSFRWLRKFKTCV